MTNLTLPESVTTIEGYCFSGCSGLTDVTLPEGLTSIGGMCFYSCNNLRSISLPSTLKKVGSSLFAGIDRIVVMCFATEPPMASYNDKAVDDNCRLFVWQESVDKYKESSAWKAAYCIKPLYPVNVIVMRDNVTLMKKQTVKLECSMLPENAFNKNVVWSSSNEDIATVTEDGEVKAVSVGGVDITAEAADGSGITAVCHVTVKGDKEPWITVKDIKFDESSVTIAAGEAHKLNVSITPLDATDKELIWKSADPSVVTVSSDGTIVGVSEGNASIYAITTDGSYLIVKCEVTVTASTGIGSISAGKVKLAVSNRHLTVEGLRNSDIIKIMNTAGITLYEGMKHEVELNAAGVYIIKVNGSTLKFSVE